MIRVLQHKSIDKEAWDECINSSPQRIIYALSWYLDVVSPLWSAVVDEQEGKYLAVMPLPVIRKFGISTIKQPVFCQQLGVFIKPGFKEDRYRELISAVKATYSFVSLYNFNTLNTGVVGPDAVSIRYTHHLNLKQPYSYIWDSYSKQRKNSLRRSRNKEFSLIQGDDIGPLVTLFKKNVAHKIYGGVKSVSYETLIHLYKSLSAKKHAELLYAVSPEGHIYAGAIFITYGSHIIYLFNASDELGKRYNCISAILDEVIRRNAGTQQVLDFESPMIKSIAGFYQSFGSTPVPFYEWHYNRLPLPVRIIKQLRQKVLLRLLNS